LATKLTNKHHDDTNNATALPHLQWAGQRCFDHLKEQEPEVLLGYAAFIALLVGLALLRRLLRRLRVYGRLRAWAQARVAAVERQYQKMTVRFFGMAWHGIVAAMHAGRCGG